MTLVLATVASTKIRVDRHLDPARSIDFAMRWRPIRAPAYREYVKSRWDVARIDAIAAPAALLLRFDFNFEAESQC